MTVYDHESQGALSQGGASQGGTTQGAVELLRDRLGIRYQASIDGGRAEIVRVLADGLSIDNDAASQMTANLIDSGEIRYVTGTERDIERNPAPQDGNYRDGDMDGRRASDRDMTDRIDDPEATALSAQGGPQSAMGGYQVAAAPVAAGSGGTVPGALPVAAGVPIGQPADRLEGDDYGQDATFADGAGYWDFGSGATGVVPSSTRKGQVEPRGT